MENMGIDGDRRRRRVILADDVKTIATTLAIILDQAGFEARAVFSGEQVVELLDSFHPEMGDH
jgi:DNA-binding response OmpR family regulator